MSYYYTLFQLLTDTSEDQCCNLLHNTARRLQTTYSLGSSPDLPYHAPLASRLTGSMPGVRAGKSIKHKAKMIRPTGPGEERVADLLDDDQLSNAVPDGRYRRFSEISALKTKLSKADWR
jgi:hypothetical protein